LHSFYLVFRELARTVLATPKITGCITNGFLWYLHPSAKAAVGACTAKLSRENEVVEVAGMSPRP